MRGIVGPALSILPFPSGAGGEGTRSNWRQGVFLDSIGFRRNDDSRPHRLRSRHRNSPCLRMFASMLFAGLANLGHAADYHAGPEDYRSYLSRLGPGDRLLLREGDYPRGLPLHDLEGRSDAPIVIEGPRSGHNSGPRARFIARPGANTVSLTNVRHVTLRNLELDGANQRVDAVKAEGHARYAHHVTLENLYIHDHAASQQNVGISSKCPAFGWIIRGNRIERVGTGIYLGDSDGSDPFVAGLIEGNHISATLGYNLQIKHQKGRPADMPEADIRHDTIIRRNVFAKTDGGPPGPSARPNVLVGHMPPDGPAMTDRTLMHGNLFWNNPGESLFQGEGNLALYNNLFVTIGPDAMRIQPHNGAPREVRVLFNTVLATGNGITVRVPENNAFEQVIAGNVVFSARPLEGGTQRHNLVGSHGDAERYLSRPFAELGEIDLSPRAGRRLTGAVEPRWRQNLPDIERDFAGNPRPAEVIGALVRAGGGPIPP
jgi:hypothetical protein